MGSIAVMKEGLEKNTDEPVPDEKRKYSHVEKKIYIRQCITYLPTGNSLRKQPALETKVSAKGFLTLRYSQMLTA